MRNKKYLEHIFSLVFQINIEIEANRFLAPDFHCSHRQFNLINFLLLDFVKIHQVKTNIESEKNEFDKI